MTVKKQRGFTIIELLVVITIIGILMAMIFPAINSVRSNARRAQCVNRTQQLAKGILNYTLPKDKFPGWLNPRESNTGTTSQAAWNWVVEILPFIEETPVYDAIVDHGDGSVVPIDTLVCPADPPDSRTHPGLSYVVNGGIVSDKDDLSQGVFFKHLPGNRTNWVVQRPSYISSKDGTKNTLLLTENLNADRWGPGSTGSNAFEYCVLWQVGSQWGLNDGPTGTVWQKEPPSAVNARPSSRHSGGFVVAFCGGNTRFISQKIAPAVYEKIMSVDGREFGQDPLSSAELDR